MVLIVLLAVLPFSCHAGAQECLHREKCRSNINTTHEPAANWAQASGVRMQNIAVPAGANIAGSHFSARYGMAVVVFENPSLNYLEVNVNAPYVAFACGRCVPQFKGSRLYVLGGDSYAGDDEAAVGGTQLLNDVWYTRGTEWLVQGDRTVRAKLGNRVPRVRSELKWELATSGRNPPPGTSYDKWIQCEPIFSGITNPDDCQAEDPVDVMWAPRRGHAAVVFKGYIYVLGGRTRAHAKLPHERAVGGIINPDVQNADGFKFVNQREPSVLLSDVWRSEDGAKWELVMPGCKAPHIDLLKEGNPVGNKAGIEATQCTSDNDCYLPGEECNTMWGTCVCKYWSPREQHAVAVYESTMFLVGGLVSIHSSLCGDYACGDTDASSIGQYMSDIWRSNDGEVWTRVTSEPGWAPRAGHQLLFFDGLMWLFGGHSASTASSVTMYFNDIWTATSDGLTWTRRTASSSWSPRTGHTVTVDQASAANNFVSTFVLVGGYDGTQYLDDVWTAIPPDGEWIQDFTMDEYYQTGAGKNYRRDHGSPAQYYISPESDITTMIRFWVPESLPKEGARAEVRQYLSDEKVAMLRSMGINTIRQFAEADKYKILKLRGFDIPQVSSKDQLSFTDVCDALYLAKAIVDKCTVDPHRQYYDGEERMPWYNKIRWGGPAPMTYGSQEWHNRDYTAEVSAGDLEDIITGWDGCEYIRQVKHPDVPMIGRVEQVSSIRKPLPELQELRCKNWPGSRAFHGAGFMEQRVYVLGGRKSNTELYQDTWYRDDRMPIVTIRNKPQSHTSMSTFSFEADEAGCYFEWRLWDRQKYKEMVPWTKVIRKVDVSWLDWRKNGPGDGNYILYVRAVDPAGNSDERYIPGRNWHSWHYVSPIPWDIILGSLGAFFFLVLVYLFERRRRARKAAMERYAMKRMRRKFKAIKKADDPKSVDWRTLYHDAKKRPIATKRTKPRDRDRQEKEKEKIRKALAKRALKRRVGTAASSRASSRRSRRDTTEYEIGSNHSSLFNQDSGMVEEKAFSDIDGVGSSSATASRPLFKDYELQAQQELEDQGSSRRRRYKDYEQKEDSAEEQSKKDM